MQDLATAPVRRFAAAAAVFFFSIAAPVGGQSLSNGAIDGRVQNAQGGALNEVRLTLEAEDGGTARTAVTSRDGTFMFSLLSPGRYVVKLELLGYRPRVIQAVPVVAGESQRLDVTLEDAPPPVQSADSVFFQGISGGSRAGLSQRLTVVPFPQLPWQLRETLEASRLSSWASETLEVEGLPAAFSRLTIDGVPYEPVRHPHVSPMAPWSSAFPIDAFASADLVTGDPDLEWSGYAAGTLAGSTQRGPSQFRVTGSGAFSGGPLSPFLSTATDPSANSFWGALAMGGPIIPDTAHFALGFEARRLESSLASPWLSTDGTASSVLAAADARGVPLGEYVHGYSDQSTVATGFGRFDWQIGADNAFSVRAAFAHLPSSSEDGSVVQATLPGALGHGHELFLSASVASKLPAEFAYELRVGLGSGKREYEEVQTSPEVSSVLPSTRVVAGGLHFGADPRLPGRFGRTSFTTAQSVQRTQENHRLKLGVETDLRFYDDTYAFARRGEYTFGGPGELTRSEGAFLQVVTTPLPVSFSTFRAAGFVQDTWSPTPDLRLVGGGRYEVELLPRDNVLQNSLWLAYTGLSNVDVPERVVNADVRLGLTWNVGGQGRWLVRAAAGTYSQPTPPEAISELLTVDGSATTRRGVGPLGNWPSIPTEQQAPEVGSRLTLLGPDFRGPLTWRGSFGVSHHFGSAATLHLSGAYRSTEFLTRRTDLNLVSQAGLRDQHGRQLHGQLVKVGQLIATPHPNRRFTDFDLVSALNANGESRYWGLTAALERDTGGPLAFFGRYTYSQTTDNWLAGAYGGPEAQLTPFPYLDENDWLEGRSDFDVPHRFASAIELRIPGRIEPRLAAVYRMRSGYPFTPGFRQGVDVNGDGSGSNDPAFVDEAVSGTVELAREWDCVRGQVGRFAERNACRGSAVHAFDGRFSVSFPSATGVSGQLFVEALNLLHSPVGDPDRALYLIQEGGSLVQNPATGVVSLPLTANPNFGKALNRIDAGRTLRIGLQLTF
jgi:hypothetical protein